MTTITTNQTTSSVLQLNGQSSGICPAYTKKGWMGRKFFALPKAAWSGFILSLAHLAQGVFRLIRFDKNGAVNSFKTIKYDLQEAFGHISILFNDRIGSNLVHSARLSKDTLNITAVTSTIRERMDSWRNAFEAYLENLNDPSLNDPLDQRLNEIFQHIDQWDITALKPSKTSRLLVRHGGTPPIGKAFTLSNISHTENPKGFKPAIKFYLWIAIQSLKNQNVFRNPDNYVIIELELGSKKINFQLSTSKNEDDSVNVNLITEYPKTDN